jgi:endonuclease/exonuclease/phosphatase family metal-dependent hydrolase
MRLLLYNIRYAVGGGASLHMPIPGAGYVLGNQSVLPDITRFIKSVDPDIVGLIEVDTGSIRSRNVNQAEKISADLGMNTSYETKYGVRSLNKMLPIVRKQGNAFMAAARVHGETFHYFDTGIKRLIIELEMQDFAIFLVHLSLKYRHRHLQLRHLHDLIRATNKPVIVAGDFNTFWGENEIYLFLKASGLTSANVNGIST